MNSKTFVRAMAIQTVFLALAYPPIFGFKPSRIFTELFGAGDSYIYYFPVLLFSKTFPLWNDLICNGIPALADPQYQSFYPPTLLLLNLFPGVFGYNLLILVHYSLAGSFTYLFLRSLRLSRQAAFLGGAVFLNCGFLMAHKGHFTIICAGIWLPLVLFAVRKYFETRQPGYYALGAVSCACSILAGYPQVTLAAFIVAACYILFQSLDAREGKVRQMLQGISMIILGFLLSGVQVFPTAEALRLATRREVTFDFFASYSFRFTHLPLLLFPHLYGGGDLGVRGLMPQTGLTEITGYLGILPWILAAIGYLVLRESHREVRFWIWVIPISFLLVLGDSTPLYRLVYHIPVLGLFRAPARNWYEIHFAAAVLAAFGIERFLQKTALPRAAFWAKRFAILCYLLIALSLGILPLIRSWISHGGGADVLPVNHVELLSQNLAFSSVVVFAPLAFLFLSGTALLLTTRRPPGFASFVLLILLIDADLCSFGMFHDTGFVNHREEVARASDFLTILGNHSSQPETQRALIILSPKPRLLPVEPNVSMLQGFLTVNGIEDVLTKEYVRLTLFNEGGISTNIRSMLLQSGVLSILGTRYIITAARDCIDVIDSARAGRGSPEDSINLISSHPHDWQMRNAKEQEETVVLASSGRDSAEVRIPVQLEPLKDYRLSLEVRAERKPDQSLVVYLQQRKGARNWVEIGKGEIAGSFSLHAGILKSGAAGGEAILRVLTGSAEAIEIRNVALKKSLPLSWNEPGGSGVRPLYSLVLRRRNGLRMYENVNFLPRVRFVEKIEPVGDPAAVTRRLRSTADLNLKATALVEMPGRQQSVAHGTVMEQSFKPGVIRIKARTDGRAFLVLSDQYYPGWRAWVDDREVPVYRTYGVLRGILIDTAGEHKVLFRFQPASLRYGMVLSLSSLAVLAIVFARNRKRPTHV